MPVLEQLLIAAPLEAAELVRLLGAVAGQCLPLQLTMAPRAPAALSRRAQLLVGTSAELASSFISQ